MSRKPAMWSDALPSVSCVHPQDGAGVSGISGAGFFFLPVLHAGCSLAGRQAQQRRSRFLIVPSSLWEWSHAKPARELT